jgi:anti-sigma regulatory factor (Ser/Thr protein kinase)
MTERRFRRDLSSLQPIFEFVRECFRARGLDQDAAWDVDLILEELFTNMLRYSAGAADVAIGIDWTPPNLTLRLRDHGVEPFDVTRAAPFDVDMPLEV